MGILLCSRAFQSGSVEGLGEEPGPGIGIRIRALACGLQPFGRFKKQVTGHRSQILGDMSAKQTCFICPASMRGVRYKLSRSTPSNEQFERCWTAYESGERRFQECTNLQIVLQCAVP